MFNPFLREAKSSERIFAAWALAAEDTRQAWDEWLSSAGASRGIAYARYQACLDHEERAAAALAGAVGEARAAALR
jgi:hypothetical protein